MSVLFRLENWKKQSMLIYQWRRTRESRKTMFYTVMRLTKCHLDLLTTQAVKRSKFPKAIFLVNLLLWINFTVGNFFSGRWALHSWCIWKKIKRKRIENTHNLEYSLPIFTFFIFYFNNYDPLKYISLNFHKYKSSTIKFQAGSLHQTLINMSYLRMPPNPPIPHNLRGNLKHVLQLYRGEWAPTQWGIPLSRPSVPGTKSQAPSPPASSSLASQ